MADIPIKIIVIGDGAVGKTSLLVTYREGVFPTKYEPTVFENYVQKITLDNIEYTMKLWDTAGQETYEQVRQLSYPDVSCNPME